MADHGKPKAQCPYDECPFRERIQEFEDELEGHGETIDHLVNTVDTILVPTQRLHTDAITRHEEVTKEARSFMDAWSGAWVLVQRVGVVLAAGASLATFVMKILEAHK